MTRELHRCPQKCGRFAPPPVECGTITVGLSTTQHKLFATKLCTPCRVREERADKRRAVLARNLRRAFGD